MQAQDIRWFQQQVIGFAKAKGRFHLPWKNPASPYRVWISEVMLQQTQVQTALPYFERFMARFPNIEQLAQAPLDDVLSLWSGLGYYRRAHMLHATALAVTLNHHGQLPNNYDALIKLPGIGPSTAGAILAQAFELQAPILDGNVKRVLSRFAKIEGYPESPLVKKQLWHLSRDLTPHKDVAVYTQGMMDLGALICSKQPECQQCPIQSRCQAFLSKSQHLYPHPKPKKKTPTKRCGFAWIQNNDNEILLIKRPTKGIWGGLWCLPCIPYPGTASHPLFKVTKTLTHGPERNHKFSHFSLSYKAVKMSAIHPFVYHKREQQWVSRSQALTLGLPAPIRALLEYEL